MCVPHKLLVIAALLSGFVAFASGSNSAQQPATPTSSERDRGIQLFKQGDTKAAIQALSRALKVNKEDGDGWYYLGLSQVRENDPKNARKAFEAAIRLKPNFGLAHTGLAYTLMLAGKNSEAEQEATRSVELNNQDAEAHYILGVMRLRRGHDPDAALQEATIALKLKPDLAAPYLLKSQAIFATYARSGTHAKPADAADLNREEWRRAAQAYFKKNTEMLKEAADALELYLKLIPHDTETAMWRNQLETLRAFDAEQNDLVPGTEVTTKARILSKPEPIYTQAARRAGVAGTVILRAVFRSDGSVKHILVLNSLPYGLTQEAVEAARRIKFVPATKDGKPVSMVFQLEYNFNLY